MMFNDGFAQNEDMRFEKCPRCDNEEYSENAKYCKICGFPAYNECEGQEECNSFGGVIEMTKHKNVGNARYCEYCGRPTTLLKQEILKPFNESISKLTYTNSDSDLPF